MIDILDHLDGASEKLNKLSFRDTRTDQWRQKIDNIYAVIEGQING
jgi:hypothetical protein